MNVAPDRPIEALAALAWPADRAAEAMDALARATGLSRRDGESPGREPAHAQDDRAISQRLQRAAAALGLDVQSAEFRLGEAAARFAAAAPALIRLPGAPRLLAIAGGRGRLNAIAPDGRSVRIRVDDLEQAFVSSIAGTDGAAAAERLLDEAHVTGRRRLPVRRALLSALHASQRVSGVFLLGHGPEAPLHAQARAFGIGGRAVALLLAHAAAEVLWIAAWSLLGWGALSSRIEDGVLVAWTLALATLVGLRSVATWSGAVAATGLGGLLKRRLLEGALRLDPEDIRGQGAGQLLGRVLEAEAVESLALSGGLQALMSLVELTVTGLVLGAGAGGAVQALVLAAWIVVVVLLALRFAQRRGRWSEARLRHTHELVERMIGHRTRLAQERPVDWHRGEDEALARYLDESRTMDSSLARLQALAPRGWLLAGVAALAPALVSGAAPGSLAVALGGVLLGWQALTRLGFGLSHLVSAWIAWRQVSPLDVAARRGEPRASAVPAEIATGHGPLLEADDLVYRHRGRGDPAVAKLSLTIARGDRLLVEGASGGGKSTLVALLSGLREPESGLVLLGGLDLKSLGPTEWRRRVAAAPQFHENHVFTGTFAFNLLLGGRWPAPPEDLARAEAVCRELGLGPLLDHMPGGLNQAVGETGWTLSHGEQGRVFIARALLQGGDLVILDETFAALDPETLAESMRAVLGRAPTLMVVAHR